MSRHGANIRAGDGSGPWSSQVGWSGQAGGRVRQVVGSGQAGGQGHFGALEVPGRQAPYQFLLIDIHTHTHTYIYIYIYVYIHIFIYIHTYIHTYI